MGEYISTSTGTVTTSTYTIDPYNYVTTGTSISNYYSTSA